MTFNIKSDYAILDVLNKKARTELLKAIASVKVVSITIEADIDNVFGRFDGTSQEFTMAVKSVVVHDGDAK